MTFRRFVTSKRSDDDGPAVVIEGEIDQFEGLIRDAYAFIEALHYDVIFYNPPLPA